MNSKAERRRPRFFLAAASILALAVSPSLAEDADPVQEALRGTVNIDHGPITDVFLINGSSWSDQGREIQISVGESLTFEILSPPERIGNLSPHVLYIFPDRADETTLSEWPWRLGTAAIPGRFRTVGPENLVTLTNTWGPTKYESLGTPFVLAMIHAPSTIVTFTPQHPMVFTIQGAIRDETRARPKANITNGIIVTVN